VPIYEFYCADCHAIFNFLSRKPDVRRRPACPRCARPRLERRISRFAVSRGRPEPVDDSLADLDEDRLQRAAAAMERELDGVDDGDPGQMARVMRKLFDGAGLSLGPGMEEALRRMEAGEDPDEIEAAMGDGLEGEETEWLGSATGGLKALRRRLRPPTVIDTLYEL
jgi:putative FmdB family regulatory protein